ncbi:MAG: hypothetical protein QOH97_371 [Actinoplanes sp.]|nr:hypothetical protein [Actinoplanes sp.]
MLNSALVLDTSAVLAYAAGSMHVHEPVLLAGEDGDDVAVPVFCGLDHLSSAPRRYQRRTSG